MWMMVRTGLSTFPLWLSGSTRGSSKGTPHPEVLLLLFSGEPSSMGQGIFEVHGPGPAGVPDSPYRYISGTWEFLSQTPERFPGLCGYLPWVVLPRADSVAGTQPWGLQVSKAQLLWAWSEPLELFYSVDGTRHGSKEDRQQPALFPSPHSSVELPGLKDSKCESGLPGPMERCLFRQ